MNPASLYNNRVRIARWGLSVAALLWCGPVTAQDHSNVPERIATLKHIGEWYLSQRDTAAARYFEELILLSDHADNRFLKSYAYYRLGVCWYQQHDIPKSSDLYFKGLEATDNSSEYDEIKAKLYNGIGWNFYLLEKHKHALHYFQLAEPLAYASANATLTGLVLNNKGVAYKNLELYDSALTTFRKSLVINRENHNDRQVRFNLNNIGIVLIKSSQFEEADTYLQEALELNSSARDTVEIINNQMNLAEIDIHDNRNHEAQDRLVSALALAKACSSLDQQRRIYFSLMELSRLQGNYRESFLYQSQYHQITDSLYRAENIARVFELESDYKEIERERNEQQVREFIAQQKFYLAIIAGVWIVTFVIVFFLVRAVRVKRANEKVLLALNAEIKRQAEELQRANQAILEANDHLEELARYRAEVIQNQSKRLLHFSFVNSHEIRSPLATLMGYWNCCTKKKSLKRAKRLSGS